MCLQSLNGDRGAALRAEPVVPGRYLVECYRNLANLSAGFVAERVNDLAIREFTGSFLGVGIEAAANVVGDPVQSRGEFIAFRLEAFLQALRPVPFAQWSTPNAAAQQTRYSKRDARLPSIGKFRYGLGIRSYWHRN